MVTRALLLVGGLGLTVGQLKFFVWITLSALVAMLFITLIFVRITVPRFRLETLSRLGWATLLALGGAAVGVYLLGLWLG